MAVLWGFSPVCYLDGCRYVVESVGIHWMLSVPMITNVSLIVGEILST